MLVEIEMPSIAYKFISSCYIFKNTNIKMDNCSVCNLIELFRQNSWLDYMAFDGFTVTIFYFLGPSSIEAM